MLPPRHRFSAWLALTAALLGLVQLSAPSVSAAPPPRHIGTTSLSAISTAAATAITTHSGCAFLTQRRLTATALAIIYKESGSGLSKAPSPMTLSRFDVYRADGTPTQIANGGLYAFRDPDTPYQRAFWHPGVGQWQLDEAGLGVDFNATERISTATSTAFVVDYLADRWCSPSSPPTELAGRYRAWGDWGCRQSTSNASCQRLVALYAELETDGGMDGLIQDPIDDLGGASARSCVMGDGTRLPCTYVDPSKAQGDTWWTGTLTGATPIAAPFYVTESEGRERRAWLREDTGYAIDITAARTMGRNSRPMTDLDGLSWASSSSLCDLTMARGRCINIGLTSAEIVPPAPLQLVRLLATEGQTPVVGDYTGDGLDDVVWYAPGAAADALWIGQGSGRFTTQTTSVVGTYQPFSARLDDDGRDDILWHEVATGRVVRWDATGGGAFASTTFYVPVGTTPLVGDFDGDGRDEIHWYGKGGIDDLFWDVPANAVVATTRTVPGIFLPRVGDYDGNGVDDVFWYGPGSRRDAVWLYAPGGARTSVEATVRGTYQPKVGDYDGDGRSDIYWYAPGSASDTIWYGNNGRTWVPRSQPITGTYQLVATDLDADGRSELVLYQAGAGGDHLWRFGADRTLEADRYVRIDGVYKVSPGVFGAPGTGGLLWARTTHGDAGFWHP